MNFEYFFEDNDDDDIALQLALVETSQASDAVNIDNVRNTSEKEMIVKKYEQDKTISCYLRSLDSIYNRDRDPSLTTKQIISNVIKKIVYERKIIPRGTVITLMYDYLKIYNNRVINIDAIEIANVIDELVEKRVLMIDEDTYLTQSLFFHQFTSNITALPPAIKRIIIFEHLDTISFLNVTSTCKSLLYVNNNTKEEKQQNNINNNYRSIYASRCINNLLKTPINNNNDDKDIKRKIYIFANHKDITSTLLEKSKTLTDRRWCFLKNMKDNIISSNSSIMFNDYVYNILNNKMLKHLFIRYVLTSRNKLSYLLDLLKSKLFCNYINRLYIEINKDNILSKASVYILSTYIIYHNACAENHLALLEFMCNNQLVPFTIANSKIVQTEKEESVANHNNNNNNKSSVKQELNGHNYIVLYSNIENEINDFYVSPEKIEKISYIINAFDKKEQYPDLFAARPQSFTYYSGNVLLPIIKGFKNANLDIKAYEDELVGAIKSAQFETIEFYFLNYKIDHWKIDDYKSLLLGNSDPKILSLIVNKLNVKFNYASKVEIMDFIIRSDNVNSFEIFYNSNCANSNKTKYFIDAVQHKSRNICNYFYHDLKIVLSGSDYKALSLQLREFYRQIKSKVYF